MILTWKRAGRVCRAETSERGQSTNLDRFAVDGWIKGMARQVRIHFEGNLTSHAYDGTLAVRIYTRTVHDYSSRLARMAEKIQILAWD